MGRLPEVTSEACRRGWGARAEPRALLEAGLCVLNWTGALGLIVLDWTW